MELPSGWVREYEGRHGAEYYYERRNLTVSVLPRYASARGRASEKTPEHYEVRVHRLLAPDPMVPVTLGRRETFDAARSLAREYMQRVDARGLRSDRTGAFAAFTEVASYDDDVLLALARGLFGERPRSLVHVEDGDLSVAHTTNDSPAAVRERVGTRIDALQSMTHSGDAGVYVAGDAIDIVWLPRGDGDGTLVEFDGDDGDFGSLLTELASYVQGSDD
jgi:hypothetical protein